MAEPSDSSRIAFSPPKGFALETSQVLIEEPQPNCPSKSPIAKSSKSVAYKLVTRLLKLLFTVNNCVSLLILEEVLILAALLLNPFSRIKLLVFKALLLGVL